MSKRAITRRGLTSDMQAFHRGLFKALSVGMLLALSVQPMALADEPTSTPEASISVAPTTQAPTAQAPTSQAPTSQARAGADCPPRDRGDSITGISVAPQTVTVNQPVTVSFTGVLAQGGCEGDFIRIPVPAELRGMTGTFPVTTTNGTQIAVMVVTGTEIVVTFNAYLESHTDVRFSGFVLTQVRNSVTPGTTYDLHWPVGEGFTTPIVTEPCDNCTVAGVGSRKFATYEAGPPPYVRWAISSKATLTVGETVVITDAVGPGHTLDCNSLEVKVGTTVDAWGHPVFSGNFPFTVDSCNEATAQVTIRASAVGQMFQLKGNSIPTVVQPDYADSGTVTQRGTTDIVRATARTSNGGGEVIGDLRKPKIDIEKWSTDQGPNAGDHDQQAKHLNAHQPERISFTITNTGNERLRDIVVHDDTTAGIGTVRNLSCDFSPLGGPSSGTKWAGLFRPGEHFTCTGVLPALGTRATHTDIASVSATGAGTLIDVDDSDPWKGYTTGGRGPAIDIEKWTTSKGPKAGDHDSTPQSLTPGKSVSISFTITNTGREALTHVVVRDRTTAGVGRIRNLSCDFSPLGGPTSGTTWAGPFKPGDHFGCTGILPGLERERTHTDVASVVGTGIETGKIVRDTDRWKGQTPGLEGAVTRLPNTGIGSGTGPLATFGLLSMLIGALLLRRSAHRTRGRHVLVR